MDMNEFLKAVKEDSCLANQLYMGVIGLACLLGGFAIIRKDLELGIVLLTGAILCMEFSNSYATMSKLNRLSKK